MGQPKLGYRGHRIAPCPFGQELGRFWRVLEPCAHGKWYLQFDAGATGLRRVSFAPVWKKSRISRNGGRKLGISSFALFGGGGGGSPRGSSGGGDASTLMEMATLVEDLSRLNGTVSEGYKGIIGADMRSRVDMLHQRATLLKQSAVRVVAEGGNLPVQLTATLRVQMSCVCYFYVKLVRYLTLPTPADGRNFSPHEALCGFMACLSNHL